ncbi:MAG: DUF3800 domain-containing protein [Acidobacteria bacterium]|nr:DUF3800 domain-containing protein [Acidobacteriota bacterium]
MGDNILDESNRQAHYSPLDILTCGLSAREREGRLFAMFGAYTDDSGSHVNDNPLMVLATLVGEKATWDTFPDVWRAALDAGKRIDYFKSSEAATLTKCFAGFTKGEAEAKTDLLTDVTLKHIKYGIVIAIRWGDFIEIIQGCGLTLKGAKKYLKRHPYFICFHEVLARVGDIHLRNNLQAKVDFMFDEQGKDGERCKRLLNELKPDMPEALRNVFGGVYHGDDKIHRPLQAADLIAWQNRNKNLVANTPSNRSYTKIVEANNMAVRAIQRDELRDLVRRDFNLLISS